MYFSPFLSFITVLLLYSDFFIRCIFFSFDSFLLFLFLILPFFQNFADFIFSSGGCDMCVHFCLVFPTSNSFFLLFFFYFCSHPILLFFFFYCEDSKEGKRIKKAAAVLHCKTGDRQWQDRVFYHMRNELQVKNKS